jgi:hypothetical protein
VLVAIFIVLRVAVGDASVVSGPRVSAKSRACGSIACRACKRPARLEILPHTIRRHKTSDSLRVETAVLECLRRVSNASFVQCVRGGKWCRSGVFVQYSMTILGTDLILGHSHRFFHKVMIKLERD